MRTLKLFLTTMLLVAFTAQMQAQEEDLTAAINSLVRSKKAKVTTSVSYSRPISTLTVSPERLHSMKSMYEIYNFEIKAKDFKLVDNIVQAMYAQRSNPACYRIEDYAASINETPRAWNLVYGEDAANKIEIGRNKHKNYTFVNIVDNISSTSPQYRTCYCIEWWNMNNKKIDGRFIITYARIPDIVQQQMRPNNINGELVDTATIKLVKPVEPVKYNAKLLYEELNKAELTHINAVINAFVESETNRQKSIAPYLYNTIKSAVERKALTKDERELVAKQLKRMISPTDSSTTIDYLRLSVKILEQQ